MVDEPKNAAEYFAQLRQRPLGGGLDDAEIRETDTLMRAWMAEQKEFVADLMRSWHGVYEDARTEVGNHINREAREAAQERNLARLLATSVTQMKLTELIAVQLIELNCSNGLMLQMMGRE